MSDVDEIVVAVDGDIYVAPLGTPLPALVRASLHSDFFKLGLISEDGAALSVAPTIDEHGAWQSQQAVRRDLAEQRMIVDMDLLQWNEDTLVFALGGGTLIEFATDQWSYDFPDPDEAELDERSIVVDWEDGDKVFRLVFERGSVVSEMETTLAASSMAILPIEFDVLAVNSDGSPGYLFLNGEAAEEPPPGGDDDLLGDGLLGEGLLGG